MNDKVLTEMVFRVDIQRSGVRAVFPDHRTIYVIALNDLLARSMAIEISNIQLSRYWKCTVAEVKEMSPVVLCSVDRVTDNKDNYIWIKSLV